MNPLVSCLCLTRNRRQWLPRAIQCFRNQTWINKELIILADGEDVSDLASDDIRYVHISEGSTIGEKRNIGSELAFGDVVISWDDDDWSAPGRIVDQVGRLRESNKQVTSYHSMLFTDGIKWWKFCGDSTANLGTSICYQNDFWAKHKFSAKQIGEDGDFIKAAAREKQLISTDAGLLMVASIHRANTSTRSLLGNQWKKIEKPEGLQWDSR